MTRQAPTFSLPRCFFFNDETGTGILYLSDAVRGARRWTAIAVGGLSAMVVQQAAWPVQGSGVEHATFDGMGDPREHLVSYQAKMQVLGVEEPLMCKAFLPTLKGLAQKWFLALPSRSIRCFNDLADRFLTHYAVNIKPQRNLTHLSGISQDEGEALKTYLTRWQKEVQTIEGLDEQVAITFFMESLRADHLLRICQNERVLVPIIEPKIVPEDVCVTEELDPEEHPEPEIPSGIPHSRSHSWGSVESLLSLQEGVVASLPSPHQKEWGEGPRGYPPPHDHREQASAGGAFLGGLARLSEESVVKEDQRHLSSSLQAA
nr:uncharacterized protein LOC109149038 [Ipomoea trifida]